MKFDSKYVVLSVTTIPSRLSFLWKMLQHILLFQTYDFDELILYLPFHCIRQNKAYIVPRWLENLQNQNRKFFVRRCSDYGPATKIIPAMIDFKDGFYKDREVVVITLDDDVLLHPHAVEELMYAHIQNATNVLGFMGTIGPIFVHSETIYQSMQVEALGGYRSILYPSKLFPFLLPMMQQMHVYHLEQTNLPIMDDDYALGRCLNVLQVISKIISTKYLGFKQNLNFAFLSNTDGVSGPNESKTADSRRITKIFLQHHHLFLMDVFQRFKMVRYPKTLHLVFGTHKKTEILRFYAHYASRYNIWTKYIAMPTPTSSTLVDTLFCTTLIHNFLKRRKKFRVQKNMVTNSFAFVLVSTMDVVLQPHLLLEQLQNKPQEKHVAQPIMFIPPTNLCEVKKDECNISTTQYDPKTGCALTNANTTLFPMLAYRVLSTSPFLERIAFSFQYSHLSPEQINLATITGWFVSNDSNKIVDTLQRRYGLYSARILSISYGPLDITSEIKLLCRDTFSHIWQTDGSNQQMDTLFGDPCTGTIKCIAVTFENGTIVQNMDWKFQLYQSHLFAV